MSSDSRILYVVKTKFSQNCIHPLFNFIRQNIFEVSTTIKSKKEVLGSRSSSHATRSNGSKLSDSMQSVVELSLETQGADRTAELLEQLADKLRAQQHELPRGFNTPYINTIPVEAQTPYPGDWKTEVRLKSLMRWNATAQISYRR